jgi:hypothetical protein
VFELATSTTNWLTENDYLRDFFFRNILKLQVNILKYSFKARANSPEISLIKLKTIKKNKNIWQLNSSKLFSSFMLWLL